MMLTEGQLKGLLRELKEGLKSIYGPLLKGLYLYGSYARGEQEEYSDVDVLIVLNEISHYAAEIDRTGQLISDLSLKYGSSVSRFLVTVKDWNNKNTSFFLNVREEVVAA